MPSASSVNRLFFLSIANLSGWGFRPPPNANATGHTWSAAGSVTAVSMDADVEGRLDALHHRPDAPGSDPSRLDVPQSLYRLTIGNLGTCDIHVSGTDPLTGQKVPAQVVSCADSHAEIDMPFTDSSRLLTIELAS